MASRGAVLSAVMAAALGLLPHPAAADVPTDFGLDLAGGNGAGSIYASTYEDSNILFAVWPPSTAPPRLRSGWP